jgi:cytochrome c peroxidase
MLGCTLGSGSESEKTREKPWEDTQVTGTHVPPVAVPVGFMAGAQSHAQSWDGRIFFVAVPDANNKYAGAWYVSVFRPEHLVTGADGTPDFSEIDDVKAGKAPEVSQPVLIESGTSIVVDGVTNGQDVHTALALVPDPAAAATGNPFTSDADCNAGGGGSHSCYRLIVFAQGHNDTSCSGNQSALVMRKAQIVVANPGTAQASIASARMLRMDDGAWFQKLTTTTGTPVCGIEPSVTADGHLMVFQNPFTGLNTDNFAVTSYSYNPAGPVATGWSPPKSIADMHFVDAGVVLNGKTLAERYPLARKPLRDATGQIYTQGSIFRGAYPWISLSGEELIYTAAPNLGTPDQDPEPGNGLIAHRSAISVIGVSTGHIARHIDGPLNPDRYTTPRLFTSSPGGLPSLWTPYPGARGSKLPYYPTRPVLPIFSSNLIIGREFYSAHPNGYAEVSYHPFEDGHYLVYLPMNEMITRDPETVNASNQVITQSRYSTTMTPDISGNLNNGTLRGAAFPPEQRGVDEPMVGANGQAIYFPANSSVEVPYSHSGIPGRNLALGAEFSVQMWVKPLITTSSAQLLVNKANVFSLYLDVNNTLLARVVVGGQLRQLFLNGTAPANQWTAVGFTYDGRTGSFTGYVNGQLAGNQTFGAGNVDDNQNPLVIGPSVSDAAPGTLLMLIDEVALSDKVRTNLEMLRAAQRRPSVSLPAGLSADDLGPAPPPTDATLIELGRDLFFDKRLSSNQQVSCASCHLPDMLFSNGQAKGQGLGTTALHVPVSFNRATSSRQGWAGSFLSLEQQVVQPLTGATEMGNDLGTVVATVNYLYGTTFTQMFGGAPTIETIGKALAAYQRTLLSGNSAADKYAAGDDSALTDAQKRGRALFFGKARCAGCHSGSNYTDERFHNTGLTSDAAIGREVVTGIIYDRGAWKTPSLRDVALTAPYLHDGSIATLQAVVEAYNNGGLAGIPTRSAEIRPLNLTITEIGDLVAFLGALTGTSLDKTVGSPPDAPVAAPQNLSPSGSFTPVYSKITLSWSPVAGATSYIVVVEDLTDGTLRGDLRSDCTHAYVCIRRADTTAQIVIRPGHSYRWSVLATIGNLVSSPATAEFSIPATAPAPCDLSTLAADTSSAGAVEYAFCLILHRQSDAATKSTWTGLLNGGTPRDSLVAAFMMSQESAVEYETSVTNEQFVRATYRQLLRHEPDASALSFWLTVLQTSTREQVVRSIATSVEFCSLHAPLRTAACP